MSAPAEPVEDQQPYDEEELAAIFAAWMEEEHDADA